MENKCIEFRRLFEDVCKERNCEAVLLSGGLDSSIIMEYLRPSYSLTVLYDTKFSDNYYSSLIAKRYSSTHYKIFPSNEKIFLAIRELIYEYKTFDPIFIRNTIVQLLGLKRAKELDIDNVAIGDGADELFGGYNFLARYVSNKDELNKKLQWLIDNMDFISYKLGKKYNISVFLPFLDKRIISFASRLPVQEKLIQINEKYFGKYFLRECFKDYVGEQIAWRSKEALEQGSGINSIVNVINKIINNEDFQAGIKRGNTEKVIIQNKEHLYYYNLYRKFFNPPYKEKKFQQKYVFNCLGCQSPLSYYNAYCKICGYFSNI